MNKRIVAWVIALLVIVGPFRWAFLDYKEPGITMMLSFIGVVASVFLFYYLTMSSKHHQH